MPGEEEIRSVSNAWREIHRRTMRLTNGGAPEVIATASQCLTFLVIVSMVSSFPTACLPTGRFPTILPYIETECSLAVCRSGVGRQSRHFRTDRALAGSIAANSAALTSAIRPSFAMHLATATKPSG
jgi:hypothetical protein